MPATSWTEFCRGVADFALAGADIIVALGNDRHQRVTVSEAEDTVELRSVVLRAAAAAEVDDLALRAWLRNRATRLVGFGIDSRGRLVATGWVPKAGVTAVEFVDAVRRVARDADLFEHQLTGADQE